MTDSSKNIPTLHNTIDHDPQATTVVIRDNKKNTHVKKDDGVTRSSKIQHHGTQIRPRKYPGTPLLKTEQIPLPGKTVPLILKKTWYLLCLSIELRQYLPGTEINKLRPYIGTLIDNLKSELTDIPLTMKKIDTVLYVICALIDETALNSPWSQQSGWAQHTLLNEFFGESHGGERVFVLLEQLLRDSKKDEGLIELFYWVLSLGFRGELRIAQDGEYKLNNYLRILSQHFPERRLIALKEFTQATPHLTDKKNYQWQKWLASPLYYYCLFFLMCLTLGLSHLHLHQVESGVFLNSKQLLTSSLNSAQQSLYQNRTWPQFLQPEVNRQVLSIDYTPSITRISFNTDNLFLPNTADLKEQHRPVIYKMTKILAAQNQTIVVTGGQGSVFVKSNKYPTSWHLSLARANTLVAAMESVGQFNKPMIPEGLDPDVIDDFDSNSTYTGQVTIDVYQDDTP